MPHVALVVDDEPEIRRFVSMILQTKDYQVVEAEDGQAALALIEGRDGHFDLLVTDCQMPHLNGVGLVKAVRGKYNIPVVMISGYRADIGTELSEDRMNDYTFLAKPFLPQQFLTAVERVTSKTVTA